MPTARNPLVGYARGNITVHACRGLETAARSCDATDEAAYAKQLGLNLWENNDLEKHG